MSIFSNDWFTFLTDTEFINLYPVASKGLHKEQGDVLTVISRS